jgi:predicted RNase H-like HicB family nuclease
MTKELAFHVEQDDGMLVTVCHDPEMATQGETLEELITMIRDLICCRFDAGDERLQWPIRLHFVNDPVLLAESATASRF